MKITYSLKVESDELSSKEISKIIGKESSVPEHLHWTTSILEKESDPPIDYVEEFLGFLEDKYEILNRHGIENSDISIWIYYAYDEQCNLEFSPMDMKRLGECGITLCISCWPDS